MFEENGAECSNPHDETIIERRDQGNGRPVLLKTGKPGRPRKVYQPGKPLVRIRSLRVRLW